MPKLIVQILFNNRMCEREIENGRVKEKQRDRDKAEGIYCP